MPNSQIEVTIEGDRKSGKTTAAMKMLRAYTDDGSLGVYFVSNQQSAHYLRRMVMTPPNILVRSLRDSASAFGLLPVVAVFDLEPKFDESLRENYRAVCKRIADLHSRSVIINVRN